MTSSSFICLVCLHVVVVFVSCVYHHVVVASLRSFLLCFLSFVFLFFANMGETNLKKDVLKNILPL